MIVSVNLAVEPIEQVKTLLVGVTACPKMSQAPLAHGTGGIAPGLKRLSQGDFPLRQGVLARKLPGILCLELIQAFGIAVVPHVGVPTVFAGQQHPPGGSTDWRSRIKVCHTQAPCSQGVDRGCLDDFLPIAPQFLITQIIS